MSKLLAHVLVLVLLATGFRWLTSPDLHGGSYIYDEADYMYAAGQGWWAHWTDSPSLSLPAFIQTGLEAKADPARRTQLSETIRQSGDMAFYRHWHGPLYFYGLSLLDPRNEDGARSASAWLPVLGIVVIYLGTLWILPGQIFAPILAAGLYAGSYSVVATTELAPHQLFVILSLMELFFLAKLSLSGNSRWWWWAVAMAALAFVTMEIAFIDIGVLVLLGLYHRKEWQLTPRRCGQSLALFAGVVLALWPAGILKLSPVRSYLFMVYLALFRRGAWGDVTFAGTWMKRFESAPMEWLLLPVALLLWLLARKQPGFRAALPFFLFGMLMLGVTLKVYAASPRYALPFLAPLLVGGGLIVGGALESRRAIGTAVTGILLLTLGAETWTYVRAHTPGQDPRAVQILATFRANPPQGPVLVPQDDVPFLHFYLPGIRLKPYRDEAEKKAGLQMPGVAAMVVQDPTAPVERVP